jgi:hydroxyacylglutathione hydrolase
MELEEGRVPGSIHIPLGELQDRVAELPRDRPIVVHCAAGVRSPMAISILRKSGISQLLNLAGGYDEYKQQVPA